ncbi:MAG TPA: PAS domain S-box protein, partial [Thermoanaerobaculia bacterium]
SLIREIPDYAIFLLSPTGEIRSWNLGAHRIFGYEADEVVGKFFGVLYRPEDLEARKPQVELEIAEREGRVEDEGWRLRKDGRLLHVNTVIAPIRRSDGSLRGFSKVTRDLTARLEAEDRLRQSEEAFRLLLESVKEYAIFMLDPEGKVATWNGGAQRILGYGTAEIVGEHFSRFYPPEDNAANKPRYELETARRFGRVEDEGWRVRKDGTRFWANTLITAIYDAEGRLRGYAKVTRDITERKTAETMQRALLEQREAFLRAEEEKRHAEASSMAAQEANRAKDAFLMTLSHELRTPMTAVLGWSRLLPVLDPSEPAFKAAIEGISRSAELQAQLIDDLLDVSRIISGKLQLKVESAKIGSIINAAVETVRTAADAKSIRIEVDLAADLGDAELDSMRIQQAVWNLLTNAVKFSPPGGKIELRARREEGSFRISVRDWGKGIEPGFLPYLFEPFRQAEAPTTRHHGGLGLGLSIARYLVESHGGQLTAASEGLGRGSTFEIVLPIRATATTTSPATQMVKKEPRPLEGIDTLIVEDDPAGREFLRAALSHGGAIVRTADSVGHALKRIEETCPDLMITDIGLPDQDGYELVRRVRADTRCANMRVAALTAFAGDRRANSTAKMLDAYFVKPVDPFALVNDLAKLFVKPR